MCRLMTCGQTVSCRPLLGHGRGIEGGLCVQLFQSQSLPESPPSHSITTHITTCQLSYRHQAMVRSPSIPSSSSRGASGGTAPAAG